jgi:translocator protein
MNPPSARSTGLLILCIAIPLVIGLIGATFTVPEVTGWYAGLQKPAFNPPAWIFAPVWTCLYILMGVSLWLVVREGISGSAVRQAVCLFSVQLALNFLWSFLFFGLHMITAAFVEVCFLFVFIAATAFAFRRINPTAAWLFAPYLCWTGFATILTGAIWLLN